MRQAAVIGIGPNDFWQMTPRWVLSLIEAHDEARARTLRFDVTIAWLSAAWPRMKRMPDLDRALSQLGLGLGADTKRQQTPEEMWAAAQQWAAQAASVRRRPPGDPTRRAKLPSLERWRAAQGKAAGEQ